MEKKIWTMPQAEVEQFEMNQYIAACGDQNKVYKFKCTSGNGWNGMVFVDSNGNGTYDFMGDESLGMYEACGAEHTTDVLVSDDGSLPSDFVRGFYVPLGTIDFKPVIIWRGENNDNVHCTENLNHNSWETAKS